MILHPIGFFCNYKMVDFLFVTGKEGEIDPEKEETNTLIRTVNLSSKVRQRMFTKAMRDFQNIQKRSKETVDNMTFTVDLVNTVVHDFRGPTQTGKPGKMGRHLPVRQKVREFWTDYKNKGKLHKILENSDKYYLLFLNELCIIC